MDKRKKIIYGTLLCALVCCLAMFLPYVFPIPAPLPERDTLPSDHEVVVFWTDIATSRWRSTTSALLAWDVETRELTKWTPLKRDEYYLNSPLDAHRGFVVVRDRQEATSSLIYKTGEIRSLAILPDYGGLSPDGNLAAIFVQQPDCELQVVDPYNRHIQGQLKLDVCESVILSMRWSPDGTHLAFVADIGDHYSTPPSYIEAIYLIKYTGTDLHLAYTKALSGTLDTLRWSPSGDRLAFAQTSLDEYKKDYAQLWVMDIEEGSVQALFSPQQRQHCSIEYQDIAWSPDGTQLAFTLENLYLSAPLWIMDMKTQEAHQLFVPAGDEEYWYTINAISWAPSDTIVIAAALKEDEMSQRYDTRGSAGHRYATFNLFEVDPVTGARTQLTHNRFLFISPDGLTWWK